MERDNQPTFNTNRNIVNFKDFKAADEKDELEKIQRTSTENSERQQIVGNPKYKFNKVTHKMDELSPDMVEDSIEALEEVEENKKTNIKMFEDFDEEPTPVSDEDIYDMTTTVVIPKYIIEICREKGVKDEDIPEVYETYISHVTGELYGTERNEFKIWCEDHSGDNLV